MSQTACFRSSAVQGALLSPSTTRAPPYTRPNLLVNLLYNGDLEMAFESSREQVVYTRVTSVSSSGQVSEVGSFSASCNARVGTSRARITARPPRPLPSPSPQTAKWHAAANMMEYAKSLYYSAQMSAGAIRSSATIVPRASLTSTTFLSKQPLRHMDKPGKSRAATCHTYIRSVKKLTGLKASS